MWRDVKCALVLVFRTLQCVKRLFETSVCIRMHRTVRCRAVFSRVLSSEQDSDQSFLERTHRGLGAVIDVEFEQQVADVGLHRLDPDAETRGELRLTPDGWVRRPL